MRALREPKSSRSGAGGGSKEREDAEEEEEGSEREAGEIEFGGAPHALYSPATDSAAAVVPGADSVALSSDQWGALAARTGVRLPPRAREAPGRACLEIRALAVGVFIETPPSAPTASCSLRKGEKNTTLRSVREPATEREVGVRKEQQRG